MPTATNNGSAHISMGVTVGQLLANMAINVKSEGLVRVRDDRVKRMMSLRERKEMARAALRATHPSLMYIDILRKDLIKIN